MQSETSPSVEYVEVQGISFEEYLRTYNSLEGVRSEWVGGEVEVYRVSNNTRHQEITRFLLLLLDIYLSFRTLGKVLLAGIPMKIEGIQHAREPDLMVLLTEHLDKIKETYVDGIADIVIEVVSPESDERDHGKKFLEYEAVGVPEYWLIDPIRSEAYVYVLSAERRYHMIARDSQGRIVSALLPGFAFDPQLLWRDSLPNGAEVINLIEAIGG